VNAGATLGNPLLSGNPSPQLAAASNLTSRQGVLQAEMLPYKSTTNPYYFPVVIVPVLVLCLRLSTEVGKSVLPETLPFS